MILGLLEQFVEPVQIDTHILYIGSQKRQETAFLFEKKEIPFYSALRLITKESILEQLSHVYKMSHFQD